MNCYRLLICLALFGCALARYVRNAREASDLVEEKGLCLYNDTWYREGEELPTRGLCLVCHCFEGFKEPDAESCAVIDCPWGYYQKQYPGCTPVYADKDCCPVSWECSENVPTPPTFHEFTEHHQDCNCDWRYLKHYEVKNCTPVYENNGCPCPTRFNCPHSEESQGDEKVCTVRGRTYEVGASINSSNNCAICNCVTDYFTNGASISCISVECPYIFKRREEGCYHYYDENHCCPIKTECSSPENQNSTSSCEYGGKKYYLGQRIYPEEDPCLICLCTEGWTGINSSSCRRHDCFLERDARQLKDGCIPIYHEKTCCPIEFYCGNTEKRVENKLNTSLQGSIPDKCIKPKEIDACDEKKEYFYYDLSTKKCEQYFGCSSNKLETLQECQNTCTQRKEQRSEPDDNERKCVFENEYYEIGSVLDIKHPTNCVTCTCNIPPDFTCIHQSCPQPSFDDGRSCTMVYKPGTCCPEYACHGTSVTSCPEPVCNGYNCTLTRDENGCSVCNCQSRCVPCPPMCKQEDPKDECSRCICDTSTDGSVKLLPKFEPESESEEAVQMKQIIEDCKKMECQPGETCIAKRVQCITQPCYPIPSCEKYELGCKLPTCSQDCVLIGRTESGCPVCQCEDGTIDDRWCPQITCLGNNCTMVPGTDGCPICKCPPCCKVVPCDAGCEPDRKSKNSTCPCLCNVPSIPIEKSEDYENFFQGDQPKEHINNTLQVLQDKCKQTNCPEGQICMLKQIHCNAEPCPPLLSCEDYKVGCQQQECPPRCVLNGRYDNNCPICHCPDELPDFEYSSVCKPPACSEDCVLIGRDDNGCPICRCEDGRVDNRICDNAQCLGYNCTLLPGPDKCPICKCLYPCQPKECPIGCELDLESSTISSTCACKCNDISDVTTSQPAAFNENCPPVTCIGYNCTVENGPNRCPVCSCKKPCSPPVCPPGCEPETEEPVDRCPGCICTLSRSERDSEKLCPEPTCEGYNCVVRSENGCLTCVCESPCVPPRCPPQCEVEQNIPQGRCPACICKLLTSSVADEVKTGEDQCAKVVCPEGYVCLVKKEQCNDNICPSVAHCVEKDPVCSIIECAAGCVVLKSDGRCPSCYCGSQIEESPKNSCPIPSCPGHNCETVEGKDGCPTCICESPCVSPLCPPECEVEKDVPDNRCPGCVCKSGLQGNKITTFPPEVPPCPEINCQGSKCREVIGADGCLLCFCDSVCTPPKCDSGCKIEINVSEGVCPGCTCSEETEDPPFRQSVDVPTEQPCSPVTCIPPRCQEIIGPNNCPRCFCVPDCSQPVCDPGCRIQEDVPDGECPTCVCETDNTPFYQPTDVPNEQQCPPINCLSPRCREITGPDNCPQCFCEPDCAQPECDPGCIIQEDVPNGECPTCICNTETVEKETTETVPHTTMTTITTTEIMTTQTTTTTLPPPTCPPIKCNGLRCRNVTGKDGCVKCVCQLKCPVPKCSGRCYPEQDPPAGRCPGCICPRPQNG